MMWVLGSFWNDFSPVTCTNPFLIPVALASRLWEVSELLHWQLFCSWAPHICKGQCSGQGATQPLSPHSAPWSENQTIRHPSGWAWSMEWGIWSTIGSTLWSLWRPNHRRWRGSQQRILLVGENHLPLPPVLWLPTSLLWIGRTIPSTQMGITWLVLCTEWTLHEPGAPT